MRALLLAFLLPASLFAQGTRLTYLDGRSDPYYVSRTFPKLTTPQWVGESGVDAVVILAIDDMRIGTAPKFEAFLRPILKALQKSQGTSAVSIMTCQADPADPQLQAWLKEGVGLDIHTWDHPCPLLNGNDLAKAAATVNKSIDVLASVPGNRPVAFRTPCCDSQNTLSPRFLAEIFNKKTPQGNFLHIDTSVMQIFTPADPELPRELVMERGQERFRRYAVPNFVNTIENYPYPYVVGRLCWEIPCVMPSDWEAQKLHKENGSPLLTRDWLAALDMTVAKKGVFCSIFHTPGWSKPEQTIALIDHAEQKYGKRVKFMTFREALERFNRHLLGGQSLRAADGSDNGVRLLDLNGDGFLDAVIGNEHVKQTRIWSPKENRWLVSDFPLLLPNADVQFGVLHADGRPSFATNGKVWHFDGKTWVVESGPEVARPFRFVDLDGDGIDECVASDKVLSRTETGWATLPFKLPIGTKLDLGLRFADIDEDGKLDALFSNEERSSLHLFDSMKTGWSREVFAHPRGLTPELPIFSRKGTENGVWFHSRSICIQNESVGFQRVSYNDLLAKVQPRGKSPMASLKCIEMRPGFEIELAAAEPLVQDPISFAFGPDGKLWVVEMGDYPLGKNGGRVKYLEDTKGTGTYDKATIFLDGLPFPTSVLPWKKGVLITAAPDILYAEDTKGTGSADLVQKLYTGFGEGNQQHRVNSLVWGLDNWIYGANGDSGGVVKSMKTGLTFDLRGRDFRFKPDDGSFDLQTGMTQFGRSRDDWNHWFGNNNSNPMWHLVLADHYLRRNPSLAAPNLREPVSITPGASKVFPISVTASRFNNPQSANHFTSACSAIVYRDDLFGPEFSHSTFVSEPVHNLIHREVLSRKNYTFSSMRALDEQTSEFLASSDPWFRPTSIQTGPDGALWVADMYRAVIEHPQWIPAFWQKQLDLRAGHDRGRIYRIVPVGAKRRPIPRLDQLDTAGLVAALDSPSGWQRDMAQMMLLWKNDRAAVPLLVKLAANSDRPLAVVHALCTLEGLGALTADHVRPALTHAHPGVREQAVRLCEGLLVKTPGLGEDLLKRTADADLPVKLQLALTLGEWKHAKSGSGLATLALENRDRIVLTAVLSSIHADNLDEALRAILASPTPAPTGLLENLLKVANSLKNTKALDTLLTAIAKDAQGTYAPWQFHALAGLLDSLDQRGSSLLEFNAASALQKLDPVFAAARKSAGDDRAPNDLRVAAVRLLGRGFDKHQADRAHLAELLAPQTSAEVQAAAIAALGQMKEKDAAELLLKSWKSFGPVPRGLVLEALLRRSEGILMTLDAVERKEILPGDFDAARRQFLTSHKLDAIRLRAVKLLAGSINADRQKVIDAYQGALTLTGDPMRGAKIFAKNCATCHRLGAVGNQVGPDLVSVGDKSALGLLTAILDPNRVVEARYLSYVAVTKNGVTLSGLLASESGGSLTLVAADGKQHIILRSDLDEFFSTGKSVMPEGVEKEIDVQAMADLLAHVRTNLPAEAPKVGSENVKEREGTLVLNAASARLSGKTVKHSAKEQALGYWGSENDEAAWTAEIAKAGTYEVWLEWSCPDAQAGNAFAIRSGELSLTGKVASTKAWTNFQTQRLGEWTLAAGRHVVTVRSAGAIRGYLFDLRSVKLVLAKYLTPNGRKNERGPEVRRRPLALPLPQNLLPIGDCAGKWCEPARVVGLRGPARERQPLFRVFQFLCGERSQGSYQSEDGGKSSYEFTAQTKRGSAAHLRV